MVAYTRINTINAPLEKVKISEMFEVKLVNDKIEINFDDIEKQKEYFIEKTKIKNKDTSEYEYVSINDTQIIETQNILKNYYNHPKEYIRGKFELCFLIMI